MTEDRPGPARLDGQRIVLGVTGGIAAYKAVILARLLVQEGATVDAVLTRSAQEFIGPATFEGITGRPARSEVFTEAQTVPHIAVARGASAVIVAPATAHLIARAAGGLADDLLTNVLLMARCPVLIAPAMHTEMWEHDATRANVKALVDRGIQIIGPASGELAGGDVGEGRLVEPDEILEAMLTTLGARDLAGRTVVVTAGGTREHLDPVRYLGNRSSGRMGYALAAEAARRGATVHLVTAPTQIAVPDGVTAHRVVSATDMRDAVFALRDGADVIVKAAAVADFRPGSRSEQKLKKAAGTPQLRLEHNPDILAELGEDRGDNGPLLVGFAAETEDAEEHGRQKLERKGVDLIVVNDVSRSEAGFEVETNQVLILGRDGTRVEVPLSSKAAVARRVWDEVVALLG